MTNVSARYTVTGGRPESWVTLETTERPEILARRLDHGGLELLLPGAICAMAAGPIAVHDGLVKQVEVSADRAAGRLTGVSPGVRLLIDLDHDANYVLRSEPGLPFRTTLVLDSDYITRLLAGRLIVVDPGHGGPDGGARGPINLWERDKCWEVALFTSQFLREAGAAVVLTHRPEENPPEALRRALARRRGAHLYLSLHLGAAMDAIQRGARTVDLGRQPTSSRLAQSLHKAVLGRFPLPDLGLGEEGPDPALNLPAARLEPVTVTNGLDEALLRSPTFKRGLGLAVLTGVKDFLDREK